MADQKQNREGQIEQHQNPAQGDRQGQGSRERNLEQGGGGSRQQQGGTPRDAQRRDMPDELGRDMTDELE